MTIFVGIAAGRARKIRKRTRSSAAHHTLIIAPQHTCNTW